MRPGRSILRRIRNLVGLAALGGAGLFGWAWHQGRRAPSGNSQYVAMGSSFAAGPGIGHRAPGSPIQCARSDSNYAHLLAHRRRLDLTDVTCSGASTKSILEGSLLLPPQVEAVHANTTLVTVTIGGNDVSYMGNLLAWSCAQDPGDVPLLWRPACRVTPKERIEQELAALESNLETIVAEVHRRAPQARLVFVDYLTVLPEHGACPGLPLTEADLAQGREVAARLDEITQRVATRSHSDLIRASELTRGHDVCAADPWVTGFHFPRSPAHFAPIAYHPTQASMDAVAEAIDKLLGAL